MNWMTPASLAPGESSVGMICKPRLDRRVRPTLPRWGPEYTKVLRGYFTHTSGVLSHSTCLASESNSIFLDARMREIIDAAGARKIWSDPPVIGDTTYSRHLMGTCRMGADPKTSVVDSWNRAHDVPNLYIVDGSSLMTSGRQQPTATIQALACRAADRILKA